MGTSDRRKDRQKKRLVQDGFTLIEAIAAMAVLTIGIVGLMEVMRRATVSVVKSWDRVKKSAIAEARLEEHKSQLFGEYVPGMQLPVIVPTVQPSTGQINFASNAITYTSQVFFDLNAETNTTVAQPGYGLAFPTPSWPSDYYYGDADSSGSKAWIDIKNRPFCDQTQGVIQFDITTPPSVKGSLELRFVDYGEQSRAQEVYVEGAQVAVFSAGSISSTPTAPSTVAVPIGSIATGDGKINVEIRQSAGVGVNDWGTLLDDGSDATSWTVSCLGGATPTATPTNTPVFTPTPTPTPAGGGCTPGVCNQVFANDPNIILNNFEVVGFFSPYFRPLQAWSGYARYDFTVACNGIYKVHMRARAQNSSNDTIRVEIQTAGGVPVATNNFGGDNIAHHDGPTGTVDQDVIDTDAGWIVANWTLAPGNYRLYFRGADQAFWQRVYWFCIELVTPLAGSPTPTPTATPTATVGGGGGTPTPTPTAEPTCSFGGAPAPLFIPLFSDYNNGSPAYAPFACDANNTALTASGTADATGRLTWSRESWVDPDSQPGWLLDADGYVKALVRLEGGMSVTLRAVSTTGTTYSGWTSAALSGWQTVQTALIPAGTRIEHTYFDFAGASQVNPNYLAVDALRIEYDIPLNPNAVLSHAQLAVLSSYRDAVNFFPPYIVDSQVVPDDDAAGSGGYNVIVTVSNGMQQGASVVVDPKFPPITIINNVSP